MPQYVLSLQAYSVLSGHLLLFTNIFILAMIGLETVDVQSTLEGLHINCDNNTAEIVDEPISLLVLPFAVAE